MTFVRSTHAVLMRTEYSGYYSGVLWWYALVVNLILQHFCDNVYHGNHGTSIILQANMRLQVQKFKQSFSLFCSRYETIDGCAQVLQLYYVGCLTDAFAFQQIINDVGHVTNSPILCEFIYRCRFSQASSSKSLRDWRVSEEMVSVSGDAAWNCCKPLIHWFCCCISAALENLMSRVNELLTVLLTHAICRFIRVLMLANSYRHRPYF